MSVKTTTELELEALQAKYDDLEKVYRVVIHIQHEEHLAEMVEELQAALREKKRWQNHPRYLDSWSAWAEAFDIFSKYSQDYDSVSGYEDMILTGPPIQAVSAEDLVRLKQLGWKVSENVDCFYKLI